MALGMTEGQLPYDAQINPNILANIDPDLQRDIVDLC